MKLDYVSSFSPPALQYCKKQGFVINIWKSLKFLS